MSEIFETGTSVAGIRIQHSFASLFVLDRTLDLQRCEMIIELGTGRGGLSGFLAYEGVSRGIPFLSFDKQDIRAPGGYPFTFVKADILDSWTAIRKIQHLCRAHVCLLYCDNGNKPKEVWLYASHLKAGSILGVHDWPLEITAKHVTHLANLGFCPILEAPCLEYNTRQRFWIRKPREVSNDKGKVD